MKKAAMWAAALIACAEVEAEAHYGGLPPYMQVAAVVVVRPDRVLVMGHTLPDGSLGPLPAREPRIFAFLRGPATLAWGEGKGWVIAADNHEAEVWAVRARLRPEGEGSQYDLLASGDGGISWSERGSIPATSLTSIVVAGGGVGWALGAHNLWRTEDGGASWSAITAPGTRDSTRERIVPRGARTAYLTGRQLLRTTDAGNTWRTVTADEVAVTDGRFVAGPTPEGLRIGRIEANGVHWGAVYSGEFRSAQLASEGERVSVLAIPVGRRPGSGPVLVQSVDGGASLKGTAQRGPSDRAHYALVGPSGMAWVDQGRQLRVRAIDE
jgi:hypothetical protein